MMKLVIGNPKSYRQSPLNLWADGQQIHLQFSHKALADASSLGELILIPLPILPEPAYELSFAVHYLMSIPGLWQKSIANNEKPATMLTMIHYQVMARPSAPPSDALGLLFRRRLNELGKSQNALAKHIDRSQGWVSQYLFGETEETLKRLAKDAPARLLSLLRFLEWTPEQFAKDAVKVGVDVQDIVKNLVHPAMPGFIPYDDEDTEEVDFWGTVSAGNGMSHATPLGKMRWERDLVKRYQKYGLYSLEVDGTSMYSEDIPYSIPPGAKVLVARNLEPKPGDVIVVWLPERGNNGIGVLKAWQDKREQGYVVLNSWNREVPPIVLTNNEPHLFQGVVVGVQFNPRELPSDIKRSKK
jgi:SOS-response transcriptional repressor LexA